MIEREPWYTTKYTTKHDNDIKAATWINWKNTDISDKFAHLQASNFQQCTKKTQKRKGILTN